jgi:hypothetical protein
MRARASGIEVLDDEFEVVRACAFIVDKWTCIIFDTRSSATSPSSARHGLRATEIAKALEVDRPSVYRVLEN